jgi:transcriptional regulator with XRE-family HTH domain
VPLIIRPFLSWHASLPLARSLPPTDDDAGGDQVLREFGARLRLARDQSGLSQEAVADQLGVTQAHISQIESGQINVSLKTIARLAGAVGCTLSLHLLPPNPAPAEARAEHFIQEAILGLVRAIGLLRAPAVCADHPPRRRRGRSQKND